MRADRFVVHNLNSIDRNTKLFRSLHLRIYDDYLSPNNLNHIYNKHSNYQDPICYHILFHIYKLSSKSNNS